MGYAPTEEEKRAASEACSPLREFQVSKRDVFVGWGILGDMDFAYRVAAIFGAVFVPSALFVGQVFPAVDDQDTTGEIIVENVAAIALYGSSISFVLVLATVFFLLVRWSNVAKGLRNRQFYVEFDPTAKMGYDSGSAGAYSYKQLKSTDEIERDTLLADFEVEPVTSRLKVYLASTLACAVVAGGGGGLVDAEMAIVEPAESGPPAQEAVLEDPMSPQFFDVNKVKPKKCGAGCVPGIDN